MGFSSVNETSEFWAEKLIELAEKIRSNPPRSVEMETIRDPSWDVFNQRTVPGDLRVVVTITWNPPKKED